MVIQSRSRRAGRRSHQLSGHPAAIAFHPSPPRTQQRLRPGRSQPDESATHLDPAARDRTQRRPLCAFTRHQ